MLKTTRSTSGATTTSRTRRATASGLAAVLVGGAGAVALSPGAAEAIEIPGLPPIGGEPAPAYGLTNDGTLVSFDLASPGAAQTVAKISGTGGQAVVGIDVRPSDGKLYAVGRSGGLFTVDPETARATKVTTLSVPLNGQYFGVDFNPVADALRVVSNTGQNLRYSFADRRTTADATLNIPDKTTRVRGIVGAAYTNNDKDAKTGTALYDLDAATDSIVLQVPANAGTITPQGPLNAVTSSRSGFDIRSTTINGRTVANTGYATLGTSKGFALYTVDLGAGHATEVGDFEQLVVDLAVVH